MQLRISKFFFVFLVFFYLADAMTIADADAHRGNSNR